jgi:anaerobic selenocysteine-containing dehydrogenase
MTFQAKGNPLLGLLNPNRRSVLKSAAASLVSGLVPTALSRKASAFAYEPYPTDDHLETVVTSCAHNCGSRHMLVAHKKGDVIVRLSTDNGTYQGDAFNTDTEELPQVRACLRGRSYRVRLYSPERLLYPMKRVGKRGEAKFKRISWDQALTEIAERMVYLKNQYGPDSPARPELCGCLLRRAAQVGPGGRPAGPLPRHVRLPHLLVVHSLLRGHQVLLAHDLRHH